VPISGASFYVCHCHYTSYCIDVTVRLGYAALPNLTVTSITPIRCYCIAHQLYIGLLMIRTCRVVTLVVRGLEMSPANHTCLVGHPAISTYRNQPLFSNSRILGKCVSSAIVAERYTATCIRHFDSFLLLQLTDRASLCKQTTATPARTASYVAPLATEIVDNAAHYFLASSNCN